MPPCGSLELQLPAFPCGGTADVSQEPGEGSQLAALSRPPKQELGPDATKPASHVGWHVAPEAKLPVQLPLPPWSGAVDASHGVGSSTQLVTATNVPARHEVLLDAV